MKVDLTDIKALENREVEKRVPVDLVTFDSKLGKFPITKKEDVALHIRNEENKRLFVQGTTELTIEIPCDRCLEEVPTTFHIDINEDCAGICKKCGKNLNHGTCDCEKTEPDPRMAVIQDVFKNFKEV